MTATNRSRLLFELHRAAVAVTFVGVIFAVLYVPPTFLEWLLSGHFDSKTICGAMGDSIAYIALFVLGFRRQAAGVHIAAKVFEITMLKSHMISLEHLLWLTDVLPTTYCAALLCKIVFFSDEDPQHRFGLKLS